MVTMMMAMATMAAKDHVPQGKSSKQTQYFCSSNSIVSHVPVIRYVYSPVILSSVSTVTATRRTDYVYLRTSSLQDSAYAQ